MTSSTKRADVLLAWADLITKLTSPVVPWGPPVVAALKAWSATARAVAEWTPDIGAAGRQEI